MDVNVLRQKLETLQSRGNNGENKKKNTNKWVPPVGKSTIRVVPNSWDNENDPFTELHIYYGIGKKPILSPKCYGEKDPIDQFIKKLRESKDKENWFLSKKLESKMRTFVPIIVRDEEEKGVRLWEFGKLIYMDLLSLIDNEDIGDFTDIAEGHDIVVTTTSKEDNGTDFNKSTIMPRMKKTPIGDNKEEVKRWLKEQPKPMDNYEKLSYDEIKEVLASFLEPEQDETPKNFIDEGNDFENPKYSPKIPNKKESKEDKFDSLFKD